jgi:hypothetical protein
MPIWEEICKSASMGECKIIGKRNVGVGEGVEIGMLE